MDEKDMFDGIIKRAKASVEPQLSDPDYDTRLLRAVAKEAYGAKMAELTRLQERCAAALEDRERTRRELAREALAEEHRLQGDIRMPKNDDGSWAHEMLLEWLREKAGE